MARLVKAIPIRAARALPCGTLAQESSPAPESLPVINRRVTPAQWRSLLSSPALHGCVDPRCAALERMLSSHDELLRFYTPNTMARTIHPPAMRPRLPIQIVRTGKPSQLDAISTDLIVIARDVPQWTSELLTIELATVADPSDETVDRVIEAIPKIPALVGVVAAAR